MTVCILGGGAWGTAVATILAHNGTNVHLWCNESAVADSINKFHINKQYLPDALLSDAIRATSSLSEALDGVEVVFEAIPVQFLRGIIKQIQRHTVDKKQWVVLSKGIEQKTFLLPTQILKECLDIQKIAVIAGPSFARDVIDQQKTGMIVATDDDQYAALLISLMTNEYVSLFTSYDLVGVQLCGALKNVITLGIGVLDGSGCTDNTKAFFLTQCFKDMWAILYACGGQQETLSGLAGLGDTVLTALGKHSRNLHVGRRLGAGEPLKEILKDVSFVPEGVNTVCSVYALIQEKGLDAPRINALYSFIHETSSIKKLLSSLSA